MTRTVIATLAVLAVSAAGALPAAAGGTVPLNFPHLTWPDTTPDSATTSKDCLATATTAACADPAG